MIVCINGPINAGKSTVARLLAARLENARFVEGDDHDGHELPFEQMIEVAIRRLEHAIAGTDETLVIAYPLRDGDHARLRTAAQQRGLRLAVISLAPPLDVALSQRGARMLDDGERARIREMYTEGYHERAFSDLIIAGTPVPDVIVEKVAVFLGR